MGHVASEVESAVREQGSVPCGDVEGGFDNEGDEAAFVALRYVVVACDVGFEGVVAGFQAQPDDPVDEVFGGEVASQPVFVDFTEVSEGVGVACVYSQEEAAVAVPVLCPDAAADEQAGKEEIVSFFHVIVLQSFRFLH
ncbi:hypothetical protein [Odoribacter lunatus]|uniref:hypothetical protein n=1 Tax=Odoribacter lunatus TaxID=2941335 RepID=UPI0030B9D9C8